VKILVVNSGSSSIKLELLEMENETKLGAVTIERIGNSPSTLKYVRHDASGMMEQKVETPVVDHRQGMNMAIAHLTDSHRGVIKDTQEVAAIGHRVVHGGELFCRPALIDEAVLAAVEENVSLAPLHNPANLEGIRITRELFPGVPQVAVFDTAFHQTIPPHAYHYALPLHLYEQFRIRRYGFHGTSHRYVAGECAKVMGRPFDELNLITIHLGNGCSMAAIKGGESIDCSLGFTPLEGLVMGTRSGDIDPAIHAHLARVGKMSIEEIDNMLNKDSGLKGLCGYNDMRDIHRAIAAGDRRAELALAVQTYRTKRYLGAFMAVLGRLDGIVFTAGIGENDNIVRARTLEGLEGFGIELDEAVNTGRVEKPTLLSKKTSRVQVWGIPTNEELAIAREAKALLP
jgi:acetate kinase